MLQGSQERRYFHRKAFNDACSESGEESSQREMLLPPLAFLLGQLLKRPRLRGLFVSSHASEMALGRKGYKILPRILCQKHGRSLTSSPKLMMSTLTFSFLRRFASFTSCNEETPRH